MAEITAAGTTGPGRSPKNALQECLAGCGHDLRITYPEPTAVLHPQPAAPDQLVPPRAPQLLWRARVCIVDARDGRTLLEGSGVGGRKVEGQEAAVTDLMAQPGFASLLLRAQSRHGSAGNIVPAAALGLPAPARSASPAGPSLQAAPGAAPPLAPAGAAAAADAAAMGGLPALQAAAPAAAAASALPVLVLAAPPAPAPAPAARAPAQPSPLCTSTTPGAAAPASPAEIHTPHLQAAQPRMAFDPAFNYKGHLQELLWAGPGPKPPPPSYLVAGQGPGPAAAAGCAVGPFTASVCVQVGPGSGASLSAVGRPQATKKAAEQAAAAALLTSPGLQRLMQARGGGSQTLRLLGMPPLAATQQQQLLQQQPARRLPEHPAVVPSFQPQPQLQPLPQPQPQPQPPPPHCSEPEALQRLHGLAMQAAWCLEPVQSRRVGGPPHLPVFQASVTINGHLLAAARGRSKAAAANAAAQAALDCMALELLAEPPAELPLPVPAQQPEAPALTASLRQALSTPLAGTGVAAEIQQASLALFHQLVQQAVAARAISGATAYTTALAAFLVERPSASSSSGGSGGSNGSDAAGPASATVRLTVVALGSGTGLYSQPLASLADPPTLRGNLLLDSHAEVVARRGLLHWLYEQATAALLPWLQPPDATSGGTGAVCDTEAALLAARERAAAAAADSVLEVVWGPPPAAAGAGAAGALSEGGVNVKFRLKAGVKLHLYISKPPCGDATQFSRPPLRAAATSHLDLPWPPNGGVSSTGSTAGSSLLLTQPQGCDSPQAAGSNASSQCRPAGGSRAMPHFSFAKPLRRLPSTSDGSSDLLPSQEALACHWPVGCALLNPDRTAQSRGVLRFSGPQGEGCAAVPSAQDAAAAPPSVAAAAAAGAASEGPAAPDSFRKMCCSDKLAAWNALGLQGALLGQLLAAPLYLTSLTIGGAASEFCEGAVCRAVCCRLAPHLPGSTGSSCAGLATLSVPGPPAAAAAAAAADAKQASDAGSFTSGTSSSSSALPPCMAKAVKRGLQLPAPFRINHPQVHYAAPPEAAAGSNGGSSSSSSCCLHPLVVPVTAGHGSRSCCESLNWNAACPAELEVCSAADGMVLELLPVSLGRHTGGSGAALTAPPPPSPAAAAAPPAGVTQAATMVHHGGCSGGVHASGDDGDSSSARSHKRDRSSSSSSFESRLSKVSLFAWYVELRRHMDTVAAQRLGLHAALSAQALLGSQQQQQQQQHGANARGTHSYAAAKAANAAYAEAKALLHQHFRRTTGQTWLRVGAAVPGLEEFRC